MLPLDSKLVMNRFKKYISIIAIGLTLSMMSVPTQAQCPMCKMSAEQNLKMGGTAGKGLNRGILFMLAMPYVIVGTLGFVWLRNRRKEDEIDQPQE